MIRENYAFSSMQVRLELSNAAKILNKTQVDVLDEFYGKLIDLLAQLILIEIKCMNFKSIGDVMLVSYGIVKFFDFYYEISEYILENYTNIPPLMEQSVMSAIAVITNCILLFQAKLLPSAIDSLHWTIILGWMEKLRDHMAFFCTSPSSVTSLQKFLIERAHGNFNTNCKRKLYNVTNNINHINISDTSSNTTFRTSLDIFGSVLYQLMHHVNRICCSFDIQHRAITKLYSVEERYILDTMEVMNDLSSSDEYLTSSGSEDSNFETDRESDDKYSDDESSTSGNQDSDSE
ncbi:unnamed protein product [Meganyctiphanes norvegica]|uniref:Uncharacterized protein n=1 Tax=Meganyctiphanes norvegica TaxID=48144 RepID=A0AAV2PKX0_MEGNR